MVLRLSFNGASLPPYGASHGLRLISCPTMSDPLDSIIGQPGAVDVLRTALDSDRVHHAWIFHGPAGVGKHTTALAFARQLIGEHPGSIENHPDVHLINKELAIHSDDAATRRKKLMTIPVDVLREHLLTPASLKSNLGGSKVLIVNEAEMMDLRGQNLLLKTLEEPPAGTYLVLVTEREDQLIPTVRSRCQRVAFHLLADADIRQWLGTHHDLDADRQDAILRFARGSIGRATLAVTYELDHWLRTVEPMIDAMISRRRAPDLGRTLADLAENFAKQWVEDPQHPNASKEAANKFAGRLLLSMLGDLCRQRLNQAIEPIPAGARDQADQAAHPWLSGIDCLCDAEQQIQSNVALPLLLNNLAVQWTDRVLG